MTLRLYIIVTSNEPDPSKTQNVTILYQIACRCVTRSVYTLNCNKTRQGDPEYTITHNTHTCITEKVKIKICRNSRDSGKIRVTAMSLIRRKSEKRRAVVFTHTIYQSAVGIYRYIRYIQYYNYIHVHLPVSGWYIDMHRYNYVPWSTCTCYLQDMYFIYHGLYM